MPGPSSSGSWFASPRDALNAAFATLVNPFYVKITGTALAELVDGSGSPIGVAGNPIVVTPSSGSSSAVTIADGADVTQGAKGDSAANNSTSSWSVIALLKGLYSLLSAALSVTFTNTTIAVTQGTAANLNATVSGTVTTTPPSHASTNIDQLGGQAIALNAGICGVGTERVVQASANVLNVTQASVLVTSTTVIAANANRIKVRIINTSTNPLWIGPTSPATVGNGAYIPGIAGYPWSTRYEGALYAIATGGTALVTVDEESSQ